METKSAASFWWLKSPNITKEENANNLTIPKLDLEISNSLAEFLEREHNVLNSNHEDRTDVDVGSIIEEINRVAAQSPLGPYEHSKEERSIDDIMREAEKIYIESSKSFEQLSQRSKTSQNITELNSDGSKNSTPTPKSVSPLPNDDSESETYSEDFSEESKVQSVPSPIIEMKEKEKNEEIGPKQEEEEIQIKEDLIKTLQEDNKQLREDIRLVRAELQKTSSLLDQTKAALSAKSLCSPEINLELEKTLEELKDSKEVNTALQLQLDTINKTHCLLKKSYEDLLASNKNLERKVAEFDTSLAKYKTEVVNLQSEKDKLLENENNLNKLLEIEKLQSKSLKLQNEKDAKCIQDLNRQIKEMERIIARKHPDSVSALIVAAKNDATESNLTARKILEDRIKILEEEASNRDTQSSRIFLDIQEKFNQMKLKYESHIEDLELHVNDLKNQLKRRNDTFDVYTQTINDETKIPQKDTHTISTQTEQKSIKRAEVKEDAHLVATIRGLQTDLSNKEKVVAKLQRELDELRKTNRKLQKEREGSLRSLNDRKEFRSYPEKLSSQVKTPVDEEEMKFLRAERDKMKQQLCRIEEDYQALKTKRLHDLSALQEAHEREIATYVSNVTPLREQLELQQVSLSTLQSQLSKAKEELMIITVERDHLNDELRQMADKWRPGDTPEVEALQKKIAFLEKRYEEREFRLRAIVHGLAQKNVTNRSCEQCAERQKQLIGYKVELDQLLATLRALK
ncbi:Centrosomal protein of 162 kDa-like Protein [Tribolium castaneum]|uniref:Centrosomal protein of 162 kDa n=2 Tax=Tribolium castaneum TaxID=7070 RepID=A0A139WE94_TRICA|nr:PREDICTED: centrosomal protein of 162 kDa isoform X1 [Tribolium castaneum]KYB26175.1 Centrosomal protein of 162 kDa-like Protein [Tribolium castaneum]|eukprot:XP_008196536.1 PREDICTED: centrosomal protein of 162 kDa isoform X1 [Tribolium castaneum]